MVKCRKCRIELGGGIDTFGWPGPLCVNCYFDDAGVEKAKHEAREAKREKPPSRHIPKKVQREVWRRDRGRCLECDSQKNLEFDHLIPLSEGGSNTARNIQLLCQECNRKKGRQIGY